jgi:hypothetical protein
MPVDINDPAVLAQAQAIAQRDGVPVEFALLQLRGNAPDATPEQYQEFLQAPGPYSKDNLPPDDGVPFNLGPESLNGGLVGAPGLDMGVDPMAGSGNPLLSDGEEGYGHFIDNSYDAGLERGVLKQSNDQAKADQKMADRMAVEKDVYNRQRDEAERLGMIEPRTYDNLVEQDPTVTGGFRQEEVQVASPTAEDPDRTVPVTRVHGGKQMTHSPDDIAMAQEVFGLTTKDWDGTPAYDYIEGVDAEGNATFVNPTIVGKMGLTEDRGVLNPHQMKQLQTRMNRMRDRSGYSDQTQYTPYRKMDGSMGLRVDPDSPEVRQKRRDQVADKASRKQLIQARGMLAGVSPTQNNINAQMLLMGGELPGGINMSEEFRRRAMQQMMPESTKFDIEDRKAAALEKVARTNKKSNMGVAEIDAQSKIDVATIGAENAAKLAAVDAALKKELSVNELAALQSRLEQEIRAADRRSEELLAQGRDAEAERQREFKEAAADRAERLEVLKQQTAIAQTTATADAKLKEAQAQEILQRMGEAQFVKVTNVLDKYAVRKDSLRPGTALTEKEKQAAIVEIAAMPGISQEQAVALVEGMAGLYKEPSRAGASPSANQTGLPTP